MIQTAAPTWEKGCFAESWNSVNSKKTAPTNAPKSRRLHLPNYENVMQNQEPQSSAYDFQLARGDSNTYVFGTNAGSSCEATFKPSGYLFAEQDIFRDDADELSINLTSHKSVRLPLADPLIAPAVVAVYRDFHDRHGLLIIYIGDSSDNRQLARYRKFGIGLNRLWHLGFIEVDVETDDPHGVIHTSLLMHRQCRYRDETVLAFLRITNRENSK